MFRLWPRAFERQFEERLVSRIADALLRAPADAVVASRALVDAFTANANLWSALVSADAGWRIVAAGHPDAAARAAADALVGASGAVLGVVARDVPNQIRRIELLPPSEYGAVLETLGLGALVQVPLIVEGRVSAVLVVGDPHGFAAIDRDRWHRRLERIADLAATALDRVTLFKREHRVAQRFQDAAMPIVLPTIPGLSFDGYYRSGQSEARVGGDWYDAVRLIDGRVVISVGDVAGSGLEAAITMASMREALRGVAQIRPDPDAMLHAADRTLRAAFPDRFVTVWVGVFDPITCCLRYASAGHPAALLRLPDGTLQELSTGGLPLGLRERDEPVHAAIDLEVGSSLVVFTDGLVEHDRALERGLAELRAAVSAIRPQHGRWAGRLAEGVAPDGCSDDVAIFTMTIDELPRRLAVARGLLVENAFACDDALAARAGAAALLNLLRKRDFSEVALGDAELIFAELLGNVVRHAGGSVEVVVDATGTLPVLHVLDDGPGVRHLPRLPVDTFVESGRGLFLVDVLSENFDIELRPHRGSHARAVLAKRVLLRGSG